MQVKNNKEERVYGLLSIMVYLSLDKVSAPCLFKNVEILESIWSMSSWVWPTDKRFTLIYYNKEIEISK